MKSGLGTVERSHADRRALWHSMEEHDRLALARTLMERKLVGRRVSSKLTEAIELGMSRPLVSTGTIAKAIDVTPQAAVRIVGELGLREMTGRGRFGCGGFLN